MTVRSNKNHQMAVMLKRARRNFLSCAVRTSDRHGDDGGEINERAAAVRAGRPGGFIPVNFSSSSLCFGFGWSRVGSTAAGSHVRSLGSPLDSCGSVSLAALAALAAF